MEADLSIERAPSGKCCVTPAPMENVASPMRQQALRFSVGLAFLAAIHGASAQPAPVASGPAPLPESASAAEKLGYKTVAAALDALKSMPGVSITVTQPDGWTIAVEPGTKAMWSFTPPGHYAHPAVVRREVKQRDGAVYVEMVALCQAAKAPCDKLIREFQLLNQRMSESIRDRPSGRGEK